MADIKVKEIKDKTIKSLNKTKAWTERVKEPIVLLNNKSKEQLEENNTTSEYGEEQIKFYSNKIKNETIYQSKKVANKTTNKLKEEYKKNKVIKKSDKLNSKIVKSPTNKIKNTKNNIKKTERITNESVKTSKKILEQGRKLAIQATKSTIRTTKAAIKLTVSMVKSIIAAVKSLGAILAAGGTVATIVVIIICLVALLLSSIFGIFFANEGESRTMTSVISQINTEVYTKAENQKFLAKADDIIVQSTHSNWKEVIAVYSVKYNNDNSEDSSIVMYLNEKNISKLRTVFYDFNTIKIDIKTENVEENVEEENNENNLSFDNNFQTPIISNKNETKTKTIIYVNVESKSLEQIMSQYKFSDEQKSQVRELLSEDYDELWLNLLYGNNAGEFVYWRQKNAPWSNILIGNSGKNMGNIGCLVTSIAMLIEKSGANTAIVPFNPGTFVEALNKNNGFSETGSLQYAAVNKVVPNFQYVGRVMLKDKTQNEKMSLIKEYQDKGYYLAVEVKGDTGQHWVAVLNVDNGITIADPASDGTSLWSTYNWRNTSQFVYFKVK